VVVGWPLHKRLLNDEHRRPDAGSVTLMGTCDVELRATHHKPANMPVAENGKAFGSLMRIRTQRRNAVNGEGRAIQTVNSP
jgi:hypothetical protein